MPTSRTASNTEVSRGLKGSEMIYHRILAYIVLFLGVFVALFTVFALLARETDVPNLHYFYGGTTIICFVISWLLLKISRKN
jgi:hypothetical protein